MNKTEKRAAAAQMLALPVNASPDAVAAAYENRLKQFMDFERGGAEFFSHKVRKLYDARVIMSHPQSRQWRAQAKLALTSETYKLYQTTLAMLKIYRQNLNNGPLALWVLDDMGRILRQLYRRLFALRALGMYELTGLAAMFIYDRAVPEHGPVVPLVVYGSMIIAAVGMGCVMASMDKKKQDLKLISWLHDFTHGHGK